MTAFPNEPPRGASAPSSETVLRDAEIDNLRTEIRSLNSEITELKSKIGEYYWQSFLASGQHDSSLKDLFEHIKERTEEVTALEHGIQVAFDGVDQPIQPPVQFQTEYVICKSCGTMNDVSAKFCSACGIALDEEPQPAERNERPERHADDNSVCPLCGAGLQEDAIFCYTCGARIKI